MRRRPLVLLCSSLLAVGLSACSAAVSTAAFKGEQHEVAQTVANLQSDATAGEEKKICANDLAGSVVARLGGASRCEAAIKSQLDQVDSLELSVRSVSLASNSKGGVKTASAEVKSIHSGKRRESTVSLVKEDGKWKISGLG